MWNPFHPKCGHWSYRGRKDTDVHGGKVNQGHDGKVAVSPACLQDLGSDLYIQGWGSRKFTDSWVQERQGYSIVHNQISGSF